MGGKTGFWAAFRKQSRRHPERLALAGWLFAGTGAFCVVWPLVAPYLVAEAPDHWGLRLYASGAGVLITWAGYLILRFVGFWPLGRFFDRDHGED